MNERKAKQTLGINWVLGMNDDIGEFDILVLTSAYKWSPCVILCFLEFHHLYECVFFKVKMFLLIDINRNKWVHPHTHWIPILNERLQSMEFTSWIFWNMDSSTMRNWIDSITHPCLLALPNTFPNREWSPQTIIIWSLKVWYTLSYFRTTTNHEVANGEDEEGRGQRVR